MKLHANEAPGRRDGPAVKARLAGCMLALGMMAALPLLPAVTFADEPVPGAVQAVPQQSDLRPGIKQPYIVKKGDTLWDIANYFFKDPHKWLKIWEQNLYITNPDLIYPGNEIRFATEAKKSGGLKVDKRQPQIHVLPAEHIEQAVDTSVIVTALTRQDFIRPEAIKAAGYVLDSPDERINYGAHDRVYMRLGKPAEEGAVFDVFRTAEPVRDPATGKVYGSLVKHLGQIRVTGQSNGITEGMVVRAFEEISRGDRLLPARDIDTRIQPDYPAKALNGTIIYIRNHAIEAGQNQIVGINLGKSDGVKTGTMLDVFKPGRVVKDRVSGDKAALPEENVGQLMVLVPQDHASIALVTRSNYPINRDDTVRNAYRP